MAEEKSLTETVPLLGNGQRARSRKWRRSGPDSALSWAVAFANFFINFLVVGLGRMSGILYVVFMHLFVADRRNASIPFSVQQATRNLFGPVAGILGQKYGVRAVTIVGGILGAASASACFYAVDLNWMTFLWGLLFGICTAMTTTLNQVPIDDYFERHRTTAGGLAFSGGCVGAFVFPVLLDELILHYGMGGTFLVMGAILLNVVPAAMMLMPAPWKTKSKDTDAEIEEINPPQSDVSNRSATQKEPSEQLQSRDTQIESEIVHYNTFQTLIDVLSKPTSDPIDFEFLRKHTDLVYQLISLAIPFDSSLDELFIEVDSTLVDTTPVVNELEALYHFLENKEKSEPPKMSSNVDDADPDSEKLSNVLVDPDRDVFYRNCDDNPRWIFLASKLHELSYKTEHDLIPFFPVQIHSTVASLMKILKALSEFIRRQQIIDQFQAPLAVEADNQKGGLLGDDTKATDKSNKRSTRNDRSRKRPSNSLLDHLWTAILLHKKPLFLLLCVCRGVFMLTFIPLVTVVVDFSMDQGLGRQSAKYVIAILSLGDLLGRLCLGWVNDTGWISLPRYMLGCMLVLGVSTATLPMMHSEVSLMPALLVFGALQGSLFVRHQVLVSRYMKSHEQTIGMGFINLLSGILGFGLPYYIGYFRDTLGSYDKMFYVNGGICVAVGLLWALEPLFAPAKQYRPVCSDT